MRERFADQNAGERVSEIIQSAMSSGGGRRLILTGRSLFFYSEPLLCSMPLFYSMKYASAKMPSIVKAIAILASVPKINPIQVATPTRPA